MRPISRRRCSFCKESRARSSNVIELGAAPAFGGASLRRREREAPVSGRSGPKADFHRFNVVTERFKLHFAMSVADFICQPRIGSDLPAFFVSREFQRTDDIRRI